ncbi:uncharacterized protein CDV56_108810 [Aspergillus thermomutatus]|uniref:Uncharacterized protein n=1 Tax=Aspergillus thermomutatus TaxID=41047 RepID=A0A397HNC9_ASPTH|nr:uncharacterized protein CDV56_108810 [Aspergillus thermomutatus]RHZ64457.1 hypothetical protein CDV56_108810 [Aspergillus thermomutatus]
MSDMEQEWKPKGRPQSTMAQAFSSTLDSVFALDSDVDHLSQTIDQKRFQMIIQTRELEELQAKIRETERRLKARQSLILDGNGPRDSAGAPKEDNEYRTAGKEKSFLGMCISAAHKLLSETQSPPLRPRHHPQIQRGSTPAVTNSESKTETATGDLSLRIKTGLVQFVWVTNAVSVK